MPALNRHSWPRFCFLGHLRTVGALLLAAGLMACGAGGRLTPDRAYSELKPKEKLPERELRQLPENVLIKIENVADAGSSYRNYVVLFINGREIAPVEKLSNFASKYTYPLRLQHGLYEVKAEYHVVGFWREQVFDIVPDEPVKVLPGKRTVLICKLDKDYKGRPLQKPVRFRLQYEDLNEFTAPLSSESRPAAPMPLIQEVESKKPTPPAPLPQVVQPGRPDEIHPPVPEPLEQLPEPGRTLTLQINTTPSGAEVTIDDRYLGQSPLKVEVSATQNHVVQISRAGYQEVMKMIDARDLRGQAIVQLLIKLEPVAQP